MEAAVVRRSPSPDLMLTLASDARRTAIAARRFAALVRRDFTASLRNVLDARAAGS
ncbi:MAG: hypothetical protein ABIR61_01120 [Casimicrobiaceae bacterium]